MSSGLSQSGAEEEGIFGFLPEDITKEIKRGKKLVWEKNNVLFVDSVNMCKMVS